LKEAAYGLPELCRARIPSARLIANPGCYPTAANLALAPLLQAGVVEREAGIVCDAKSGVSGAGRKPNLKNSFCEVTENFGTYAILEHRHVPEILMTSGLEEGELSFTAQLLPIDRGILETIYFRAREIKSGAELVDIYTEALRGGTAGADVRSGQVPDVKSVSRTHYCDLGCALRSGDATRGGGGGDRQFAQGRGQPSHPEYESGAGVSRDGRPAVRLLIKLGGALVDDPAACARLASEIAAISREHAVVVVHGGGKQLTRFLAERGGESRFVNGLRVTTPEVLDGVLKVLGGSVNAGPGHGISRGGARPVGLSGLDAGLVDAELLSQELGAVGRPTRSDARLARSADPRGLSSRGRVRGRRRVGKGLQRKCGSDGGGMRGVVSRGSAGVF
jgi:hypothetical protein